MAVRTEEVRVTADVSNLITKFAAAGAAASGLAKRLDQADGRMANIVQTSLALGPALVPLGAAAIPAIAGLTTQLGLAVVAAGTAALAFNGVGTALKAIDAYQATPTAANLEKLRLAMDKLGPAGQDFVVTLNGLEPKLKALQATAQAGLFPGLTRGLNSAMALFPEVNAIIGETAKTLGDLGAAAGHGLNDEAFRAFFDYIKNTARPVLIEMGETFGNFFEGITSVIIAFDPLSRGFSRGLLEASDAFRVWAAGLSQTDGFRNFVDYIRTNTPEALSTLGSLANALLQIVEAAAPVGHAALPIIKLFGDALAALADSPVGATLLSVAAAIGVMGRSLSLLEAAGFRGGGVFGRIFDVGKLRAAKTAILEVSSAEQKAAMSAAELATANRVRNQALLGGAAQIGKAGAFTAGLVAVSSGLPEKLGAANTATLALMGTLAGPFGAATGAAVGAVLDFKAAVDKVQVSDQTLATGAASVAETLNQQTGAMTAATRAAAVKTLQDQGLFDTANRLGVSLTSLTDAYLGNGDAIRTVGEQSLAGFNRRIAEGGEAANGAEKDATLLTHAVNAAGGAFDSARSHIAESNRVLGTTKQVFSNSGAAARELMEKFRAGASSVDEFAAALQHFNDVLSGRANFRSYEAAIDDFTKSLKDNGKTFDENTPKGRANAAALDNIAGSALNYAKGMKNAENRSAFLKDARKEFIAAAIAGGKTADAAGRLANKVGLIKPIKVDTGKARDDVGKLGKKVDDFGKKHPKAKADVDTGAARDKVDGAGRKLDAFGKKHPKATLDAEDKASGKERTAQGNVNRFKGKKVDLTANNLAAAGVAAAQSIVNSFHGKSVDVTVNYRRNGTAPNLFQQSHPGAGGIATGGHVTGPGTGTSDSIPAWLSNGEYVVKAAAVDKYGVGLLHRINSLALAQGGYVRRGFASGGTVTAKSGKKRKKRKSPRQRKADRIAREIRNLRGDLKNVLSKRKEYASTVSQAFVSDPFSVSLAGFNNQVKFETKRLAGAQTDLRNLRRAGLSGGLLKDLAASGNAELIHQFAGLSKTQIAAEEKAYHRRNSLDVAVGKQAASAVFPGVNHLTHEIRQLTAELHHLRHGKHVGNHVTNFNGKVSAKDTEALAKKIHEKQRQAARLARNS